MLLFFRRQGTFSTSSSIAASQLIVACTLPKMAASGVYACASVTPHHHAPPPCLDVKDGLESSSIDVFEEAGRGKHESPQVLSPSMVLLTTSRHNNTKHKGRTLHNFSFALSRSTFTACLTQITPVRTPSRGWSYRTRQCLPRRGRGAATCTLNNNHF